MGKIKFYLLLPMIAVLAFGSVSFAQSTDMEVLKAELRAELKAELKQELLAELKSETKADIQEATVGMRSVLKADFKDEIRAEIMQEDISSAVNDALAGSAIMGGLFKGVTVGGFMDVNYMYNFRNHGEGDGTGVHLNRNANQKVNFVGENEDNSFTFQAFAMFMDKEATDEHPIGWQMHTYWGETSQRITFAGPANDTAGSNNTDGDEGQHDRFVVAAANITWKAPVFGKHVDITMGKIYTWIGYELVENVGNPNYTHGTVYNNAIPFTHTGMSIDVSEFLPSDKMGLTLYVVNGWDSYIDNNETKSGGFYFTYTPNDDFFISLATIIGGEGWGYDKNGVQDTTKDGNTTMMYDVVATYALPQIEKLSLGFNWDHGYSRDTGTDTNSGGHWWAAVGYAMYDYTDNQQGALRYEYFDDTDGVKGFDQSMWTLTYTHNITIADNLMLRPEIRYNSYSGGDSKQIASGGNPNNLEDNETIFAFGTEYVF